MTTAPHPDPKSINEQVERIVSHPLFSGSERLIRFLRFTVQATLEGRGTSLKEYVIGIEVYQRQAPYDPRIDSVVRVEARRLRSKLKLYYEDPGRADPIRIDYKPGTYMPAFVPHPPEAPAQVDSSKELFPAGHGASIAIMPFIALNKNEEDEAFADGLTDEIIYMMSRSPGIRVIARSSIFQYKNQYYSPSELTQKFSVQALMQGTVRRDRGRFRVTVELSGADGYVVWSERFEADDAEYFLLQEQIAAALVSRSHIDGSQVRSMQAQPSPLALQVFGKVCRARQLIDSQNPEHLSLALEMLLEVTRSTPQYSRAFSGLSDCYADLFRLGYLDRSVAFPAAYAAAKTALELDPGSVDALCALGVLYLMQWDWPHTEEYLRLAGEAGGNARTARYYASYLALLGRHDESLHHLQLAKKVDPFSVQQRLASAMCLFQTRQYDALIAELETNVVATDPVQIGIYLALAHIFRGSRDAAVPLVAALQKLAAGQVRYRTAGVELTAWLGEHSTAVRLREALPSQPGALSSALICAALGELEQAQSWLEQAAEQHEPLTMFHLGDPRFDAICATERFIALRTRFGLPKSIQPALYLG